MRNYTRFIPGEEIAGVAHWNFGDVDASSLSGQRQVDLDKAAMALERDETLRQEGYSQGYAAGYAQAQAQAVLETQRQIDEFVKRQGQEGAIRLGNLFESAEKGLAEAEQDIAQGVLELACELARQIVRQELAVNPNALQPVVREALDLLITDGKSALIRLHPADVEMLRAPLEAEYPSLTLTILADSSVNRGGCSVEAAGAVVDGRLEKRWKKAVATLGLNLTWSEKSDD